MDDADLGRFADEDAARAWLGLGRVAVPRGPNQRWSVDVISSALSSGSRFELLAIVDDFTREPLALIVDTSMPCHRVLGTLDHLFALRGKPLAIFSDQASKLDASAVFEWSGGAGVDWHRATAGKLPRTGAEVLCARLQRECLSKREFASLTEASAAVDGWRREYNAARSRPT